MSKRFTDTDKYKKPFIRSLPGAYKLLWDYMCNDCNHAGIWIKDFEIAQIFIGSDMQINEQEAIKLFNSDEIRIVEIKNKQAWFIIPFVDFQYGELNEKNRAHNSVISILKKNSLYKNKPLTSPLKGCKDKDKDKDKDILLNNCKEDKELFKLEIGKLFNRRKSTEWDNKEIKKLNEIIKRTNALDELQIIVKFYNSGYKFLRLDIITLLNNWTGELDKANNGGNNGKATTGASHSNDRTTHEEFQQRPGY